MDWLRRNWPDLAIGIALVAVIAGIVATLLTGGSFFPLGPSQPATTPVAPPAVTEPQPGPDVPPGPTAVAPDPATPDPATPDPVAPDPVAPDPAAPEPRPDPAADEPAAVADAPDVGDEPTAVDPPAAPTQPGVAVLAPDGTPAVEADPAPVPPVVPDPAPPSPEPAPDASPDPAPDPALDPAPAPEPAPDPAAPFRVAVGAFADPDNAARQADTFRTAGYPVFTGTQGNLTIVLVGPYDVEADAAAVAAQIRDGEFGIDPVIYRFDPDAAASTPAAPAPVAPDAPSVDAAPTPAADAAPAASPAVRYLQVGAFASAESAQPLRDRLASLGYATSEVREDGMLKLLVGPFDAAGLGEARQRLAAQGIESFAR